MNSLAKLSSLATPIAVVIAGALIAGAVLWSNTHPAARPVAAGTQQPQPSQTADITKVKLDGEPFIGSPNAPVTMAYWYDYQCPFCHQNEEQTLPQIITNYVDTGKVKIVFKDFQFLGPDSQTLGQFSRAVWEAAPDKFYDWHKAVYDNQGKENTGWATHEKIMSITTNVLGADLANRVDQLVKTKGAEYQKIMDADKAEGSAMGVTGTPGAVIGKQLIVGAVPYEQFKTAIDAALAAK